MMNRNGSIYGNGYIYLSEVEIYPNDITIGSYEVSGFGGSLVPSYQRVEIRRKGDRFPVPNEEQFLTKDQKERDVKTLEWKEKYKIYKREMKEKRRGNDIQAIRGTIGMLPNTGVHTWQLQWNHEPSRQGTGDSFGMCSDGCENWGPAPSPLLGGAGDQGCSIVLDAKGDVYHKGVVLCTLPGFRQRDDILPVTAVAATEPGTTVSPEPTTIFTVSDNIDTTKSTESTTTATTAATAVSASTDTVPKTALAPLYGKGCIVKCQFDTGTDGGVLTFRIERVVVSNTIVSVPADLILAETALEYTVKDVFTLLGGQELFPVISMSPLDPVIETATSAEGGDNTDGEEAETAATEAEEGEEGKVVSELQRLVSRYPSVTLLPHEDESFSSEMQVIMTKNDVSVPKPALSTDGSEVVESTEAVPADTNNNTAAEVKPEGTEVIADDKNTEENKSPETPAVVEGENNATKEATTAAADAAANVTTAVEVPIEKVRWMYEGDTGWSLYSVEASRLLEENQRDGKQTFLLTIGETTHTCNLESKKLTLDTGDKEYRIRRHVVADGLQGQWEMLSMVSININKDICIDNYYYYLSVCFLNRNTRSRVDCKDKGC